jgi:hypothetical protein
MNRGYSRTKTAIDAPQGIFLLEAGRSPGSQCTMKVTQDVSVSVRLCGIAPAAAQRRVDSQMPGRISAAPTAWKTSIRSPSTAQPIKALYNGPR